MLSREQLDMYSIWRCKCIDTMKDKLRLNVAARSKKLEEVVNDCIMNINKELQININHNELNRFQLSDNLILSSLEEMYNKLDSWNGVNISSCKKIPHSFDEYWYIADNWWNRQKAFWFGDYYFYQLFIYLYNFCSSSSSNNIYRDILFYNILYDIINANVSFKRARPQPLLFDQSLEKSTDLKQYFIQLLSIQQFTSQSKQKINKKNRPKLRSIICQKITQIKDRKFNAYFKHFSSSSSSLTATTTATTTNYTNYSNDNNRQSRTYINNNNIPPTISIPTPTPIPIPMPISLTTANSINSSNSTPIPVSTPTSTTSSSLSLSSSSCTIPIYHPPQQQQQQSQYQQFGQQSLPQQTQQQQQQFVDINNNNNNNNINAFDTYQNNANICNYNHVQNAINESSMNIFNDNNTIFCNYENNQQLSGFGTIYVNDDDDDNDIFVGDHVNDLNMDNKSYFVENTLLQNEDDMMSLLNFPPSFAPINNNYNNYNNYNNNNNNNNNNNYNNNNNNALY